MRRPAKTLRLVFNSSDPKLSAYVRVMGNPAEVRLGTSDKVFLSVRDDGISLSPGLGGNVNIQGLSQNLRYGGILADLPFPLSMIPSTAATPMPKQIMLPPMGKIIDAVADISMICSTLVL